MSSPDSTYQNGTSPRVSFDAERILASPPPSSSSPNSHSHSDLDGLDPIQRLQEELKRAQEEKDTLASQYRNLLAKLTTMRTTLGNKLKQDAEELDRQEQLVQTLTAQNDDLIATVEALKAELIASNEEGERASKELEVMRNRALQDNAQEAYLRERELRDAHNELEQCRMERDEWESKALQEHIVADEAKAGEETSRRELEMERDIRLQQEVELQVEREKSSNLQSVLEDFQAAKDHELQQAVKDYESQLIQVTQSLAEYKHRALTAELQLEELSTNNSRTQELEKEVKEKNLLIGKLRHEGVIMNEHLIEALRRLRRSSTDTNVDRRLVTNVLLSFLTTPRADSKRFEMLSLLATVLNWTDDEREKAGLQHKGSAVQSSSSSAVSSLWGRSSSASPGQNKNMELGKADETESFSRLWVEFLLTEASAGDGTSPSPPTTSLPGTPTRSSMSPSHLSGGGLKSGKRLPSFNAAAMASSPNLTLPPRKGREKAVLDSDL